MEIDFTGAQTLVATIRFWNNRGVAFILPVWNRFGRSRQLKSTISFLSLAQRKPFKVLTKLCAELAPD